MKTALIFAFSLMNGFAISASASSSLPMSCGPVTFNLNGQGGTVSAPLRTYEGRVYSGTCSRYGISTEPFNFTCTISPTFGSYVRHSYDILLNYDAPSDKWTVVATSDEGSHQEFSCDY